MILPSSVVSSEPTPRYSVSVSQMTSPPMTAHSAFVHTPTLYSPLGWRRYWL